MVFIQEIEVRTEVELGREIGKPDVLQIGPGCILQWGRASAGQKMYVDGNGDRCSTEQVLPATGV